MNTIPSPTAQPPLRIAAQRRSVPPLENGAKLDAKEFMRRYEAMPELRKAELIEGIVYIMASPVRYTLHGKPDGIVKFVLGTYRAGTQGVELGDNCTVKIDDETIFQPDCLLRISPKIGGKSHVDEEDYIAGAPELLVEVAASSVSMDTHRKMRAYEKAGVPEYIVWRTEDSVINWWVLENGAYRELLPDADDIIRSRVFPGLWLDPKAMLADDCARMKAVLEQGLQSSQHAAFVNQLQ